MEIYAQGYDPNLPTSTPGMDCLEQLRLNEERLVLAVEVVKTFAASADMATPLTSTTQALLALSNANDKALTVRMLWLSLPRSSASLLEKGKGPGRGRESANKRPGKGADFKLFAIVRNHIR